MLRTACKADFDTLCVLSCICMTVSGGVGGGGGLGLLSYARRTIY